MREGKSSSASDDAVHVQEFERSQKRPLQPAVLVRRHSKRNRRISSVMVRAWSVSQRARDSHQETSLTRLSFVGGVVAVLLAMIGSAAVAQSTGRISGRVVDESGAVLPGVTITANAGDQRSTSIVLSDGTFAVTDQRPGLYTLAAALDGFRTERRRVDVKAGETSIVDFRMRAGCFETVTISSHPPVVDSRLPARSDLVAYLRIEERIDEDSPSDPDCRVRHRVTVLRTLSRPSYSKPVSGTADVFLNASPSSPSVQSGKEYIIWLTWRAAKNAFDSGDNVEGLVRPVEQGQVKIPRGPCVDIPKPPPDYCPDTYSVDALFRIFEAAFR